MIRNVVDKKIIDALCDDLPETKRPFRTITKKIGISEGELLKRIRELKEKKILRRYGASLYHRSAGYRANAIVVWKIPEDRIEKCGKVIATFPEVSHCYERKSYPEWRYNVYSVLHGSSKRDCISVIKKIADRINIDNYKALFSIREYKKSSFKYYNIL